MHLQFLRLLFLGIVLLPSFCRASAYSEVDSFVRRVSFPVPTIAAYDSLIGIFDKQFSEDDKKVRAVYFWVTEHISYDGEGLYNGNMIGEKTGALKYKRCVCAGYADLLHHAFKKLGLESIYVVGKARMLDGVSVWDESSWKSGHAWNAVKVNNEWKLIDATWASGYLSGKSFYRERKDVWFFTPPSIFLLSHYPLKSAYQFIDSIISEEDFYKQVFFLYEFGQTGITGISHSGLDIAGEPGDVMTLLFSSTKKMTHLTIIDRDERLVKKLPLAEKDGKYYCRYLVGSVRAGSYFVGFLSLGERGRVNWEAKHALGYYFKDTGTAN